MTFGEELRRLLDERHMTQRELARLSHYDSGFINKLCRDKRPLTAEVAAVLEAVLDSGGALMALVNRRQVLAGAAAIAGAPLLGALNADERERLAWAQHHPRRIDQVAVESLTAVLAAQRRTEDSLGSAAVLGPITSQLAAVEDLVTEARGPIRHAVVDVAMQWTQFAARLNIRGGDFPAGRALLRQTLELATEVDDPTMITTVLRLRSYMASLAGEPGPTIGLAEASQRDSRAAVSERAYGASLEASGHAVVGDTAAAERKLDEVRRLAGQLGDRPEQERPWSYWYTAQWFECQRGKVLADLAAHADRYRIPAVEALTAGYQGLGADAAVSEWGTDYIVHRAAVHVHGGDLTQAVADALEAVPVAQITGSLRLRGMLTQLHAAMAARWPDDSRVAELADAIR
jgi:plasmid maintenance system antidote protein VapI